MGFRVRGLAFIWGFGLSGFGVWGSKLSSTYLVLKDRVVLACAILGGHPTLQAVRHGEGLLASSLALVI